MCFISKQPLSICLAVSIKYKIGTNGIHQVTMKEFNSSEAERLEARLSESFAIDFVIMSRFVKAFVFAPLLTLATKRIESKERVNGFDISLLPTRSKPP